MLKAELEAENKKLKTALLNFENFEQVRGKIKEASEAVFRHDGGEAQAITLNKLNAIFDSCGF